MTNQQISEGSNQELPIRVLNYYEWLSSKGQGYFEEYVEDIKTRTEGGLFLFAPYCEIDMAEKIRIRKLHNPKWRNHERTNQN